MLVRRSCRASTAIGERISLVIYASDWIDYPADGLATMTHYTLPDDFIAACGCVADSSEYPTAALNQMAYGSSKAYGPACGRCFNLTLLNTYTGSPPFFPKVTKSIVVKITDLCPLTEDGWCSGTKTKNDPGGHQLNFDLAYPSDSIPEGWFPSNVSLYGYSDFGAWNISYQSVSCNTSWEGASHRSALGSVSYLTNASACCPIDPTGNDTCPSYSDDNGIA
ncbi:hypothetical protein FISHEDRAFT_42016 [Fistulina hepatica ATCC 64428]|uniref:Expansin-like EG45 domain-containing protein n=1 Tax=Fistulina hepatica ATCC 64428 TaxID=1128425 RepID=A0A0D7AFD5_9AGAR|nr:hypothetical protein FISHEDRAFT_42016 [Fistulina hepatica ATCC 64428]